MILRSSPASPFGRKVKMAAIVLGLMDKIEIVVANTLDPDDAIRKQNPLGKIPALTLDDGTTLYDSRVIVEYLDVQAGGGKIIPASGKDRFDALTLQALADGIMDAAILQIYFCNESILKVVHIVVCKELKDSLCRINIIID
jgi:glutathione S-transferase